MAVNYIIEALVIDIQKDKPQSTDRFLVDSNVWYWLAYSRAIQSDSPPKAYQLTNYPAYIGKARSTKARLLRSSLSLAELAHLIEKTEREIFNRVNRSSISNKEYRYNYPRERGHVVTEIETAWRLVETIATSVDVLVDKSITDNALLRCSTQLLDGYDLFNLEAIARAGVYQVITDDCDFVTVPRIQVFTANRNVITAARNQGQTSGEVTDVPSIGDRITTIALSLNATLVTRNQRDFEQVPNLAMRD